MSAGTIVEALDGAFPARPEELDEVWFMHNVAPGTVNVHNLRSGGIWVFDPGAGKFGIHNPHGPQLAWTT
jgi:hypothetical protein